VLARPRAWCPTTNRRVLRKIGSLIFPDMPEAKGQRDSRQRSCINTDLAAVVYALVSDLLDDTPLISQVIEQMVRRHRDMTENFIVECQSITVSDQCSGYRRISSV
jgi:hypothetical protein